MCPPKPDTEGPCVPLSLGSRHNTATHQRDLRSYCSVEIMFKGLTVIVR